MTNLSKLLYCKMSRQHGHRGFDLHSLILCTCMSLCLLVYFYQICDEYIVPAELHHVASATNMDAVLSEVCKEVRYLCMILSC